MTLAQFKSICQSEEIESIVEKSNEEINDKQKQVRINIADPEEQIMTASKKLSMNVGIELDSTGPTNNQIEEE